MNVSSRTISTANAFLFETNASAANVDAFTTKHNNMKFLLGQVLRTFHGANLGLISDLEKLANLETVRALLA